VLSQNDSSEPWVVTPNNQEIPDLTTWSVFCSRKLVEESDRSMGQQPSTIYSQHNWSSQTGEKAMSKIINEPFAPKRRRKSGFGLWDTFFAALSVVLLKTQRPLW